MEMKNKIREDLINEIFNESTINGNVIGSSIREDELTDDEFHILFKKQIEVIKNNNKK
tara:strand:- start:42216 stop:42389 length:174 start_codon:yes stop_codon:yes gene_type:complete